MLQERHDKEMASLKRSLKRLRKCREAEKHDHKTVKKSKDSHRKFGKALGQQTNQLLK